MPSRVRRAIHSDLNAVNIARSFNLTTKGAICQNRPRTFSARGFSRYDNLYFTNKTNRVNKNNKKTVAAVLSLGH